MTRTKQLLRKARSLYNVPGVPASTNRHNRKALVRSILFLGDKWLLSPRVSRKT